MSSISRKFTQAHDLLGRISLSEKPIHTDPWVSRMGTVSQRVLAVGRVGRESV